MRKAYRETRLGQLHRVEAGSGRPLLLLPPAPRSWRVLEPLIARLSQRHRVIAIDPPGCGESAAPTHFPDFETIADALADALADIDTPVTVFGLHAGLKLGVALAARHPDRVERLILCGKSHSIAPDMELRNRATMSVVQAAYFSGGAGESAGGDVLRAWFAEGRNAMGTWFGDAILTASDPAAMIRATAAKLADGLLARDIVVASYRANFAFDLAAAARLVRAPATVIEIVTPEEDAAFGRQGAALAQLMRHAETVAVTQTDPTGLALYIGFDRIAELITASSEGSTAK